MQQSSWRASSQMCGGLAVSKFLAAGGIDTTAKTAVGVCRHFSMGSRDSQEVSHANDPIGMILGT